MRIYRAQLRHEARWKADVIEAVAFGYGGVRSKDGPRAMQQMIDALRRD